MKDFTLPTVEFFLAQAHELYMAAMSEGDALKRAQLWRQHRVAARRLRVEYEILIENEPR